MIDNGRETSSRRRFSVEVRLPVHDPDLAASSHRSVSRIPCAGKNELSLKINITLCFLLMQLKRLIIEMFLTGQFFHINHNRSYILQVIKRKYYFYSKHWFSLMKQTFSL